MVLRLAFYSLGGFTTVHSQSLTIPMFAEDGQMLFPLNLTQMTLRGSKGFWKAAETYGRQFLSKEA